MIRDTTTRSRTTGVYHLGTANSSCCNGRSGSYRAVDLRGVDLTLIDAGSICKKCFGSHDELQYQVDHIWGHWKD